MIMQLPDKICGSAIFKKSAGGVTKAKKNQKKCLSPVMMITSADHKHVGASQ